MKRLNIVVNVTEETIERSKSLMLLELDEGKFAVSSGSKPTRGYLVTLKDGCACKGYGHRGDCAHKKRVEAFLDEREASTT